jgi:hypothetical protein
MTDVDEAIERLAVKGMQINTRKCEFAKAEVEYLGFTINREGIKPQATKIKAITGIQTPRNQTEIRAFVGMVNFYKDMWPNRASTMAPLTTLCGKGVPFTWAEQEQKAFEDIKAMIAREVMLAFPKYGETFEIWTDASERAISGGIKQGDMWVGFFSKKLTPTQQKYPVTEQELLAIVVTLKAFRHMLLGQKIIVCTDHKNLTYATTQHTCDRVLRQRLLLEEYGVDLVHIKGKTNNLADALSRLPFDENPTTEEAYLLRRASEMEDDFPLSLPLIAAAQATDEHLTTEITKPKPQYIKDTRSDMTLFVTREENKIYVPEALRADLLNWYHDMLLHPGEARMVATIKQHFYWKGMDSDISQLVKTCEECQKFKITAQKKYGKIPLPNNVVVEPWNTIQVDMIGPWTVSFQISDSSRSIQKAIQALTIIDKATGWVEFIPTLNFSSKHVAQLFDAQWLCRYPRPKECIFDNGNEFVGGEFQEMLASYGIKPTPTTVKNPTGNAAIERVHLTMGDMLRTMHFTGEDWFQELTRTLQQVAWAVRSTVSTSVGYSPGQLIFNRDMIMETKIKVDWLQLNAIRLKSAQANNQQENKKRINHTYNIGDKVLILLKNIERGAKLNQPTQGPFTITQVYNNGTVKIDRGSYEEIINIRRLKPFNE